MTWLCLTFSTKGGPQGYHGYHDDGYYEGGRRGGVGPPMGGPRGAGPNQRYGGQYGPPPPPPGEYSPHAESPVIMVYGLDPNKMNSDRVFNIFCLYGNVERVRVSPPSRGNIFLICSELVAGEILAMSGPDLVCGPLFGDQGRSAYPCSCFSQVKFMKSKPGACMVEMGDCYAVDRAISHLNNNFLFNQKLNVW